MDSELSENAKVAKQDTRIEELNMKCTQVLVFLSFAIVAVGVILSSERPLPFKTPLLQSALTKWVWAIFPTLVGILPLKEFGADHLEWYTILRWLKVGFLWISIILVGWGALDFALAL